MSWIEGRHFRVRRNGSRFLRSLGDLRKLFQLFCLPPPSTEALEGQTAAHRPIYTVEAKNWGKFLAGSGTGGWAPGQQRALPHWVNSGTPNPPLQRLASTVALVALVPARGRRWREGEGSIHSLHHPGWQWRSDLRARAIGQSLVTRCYLAVKDAGRCSLAVCPASVVIRRREWQAAGGFCQVIEPIS